MKKAIYIITASAVALSAAAVVGIHTLGNGQVRADFTEAQTEALSEQTVSAVSKLNSDNKTKEAEFGKRADNITPSEEKEVISENGGSGLSEKTDGDNRNVFSAKDFVDGRMSYTVTVDSGKISYEKENSVPYKYEEEENASALEHLRDFFGNDNFPVDKSYEGNLTRLVYNGIFVCDVPNGTAAVSPVEGNVLAVDFLPKLGNVAALEFDGEKVLILAHFDEIYVKAGDKVTVGESLGVCGTSGAVDRTRISMIALKKDDNADLNRFAGSEENIVTVSEEAKGFSESNEPMVFSSWVEAGEFLDMDFSLCTEDTKKVHYADYLSENFNLIQTHFDENEVYTADNKLKQPHLASVTVIFAKTGSASAKELYEYLDEFQSIAPDPLADSREYQKIKTESITIGDSETQFSFYTAADVNDRLYVEVIYKGCLFSMDYGSFFESDSIEYANEVYKTLCGFIGK